MGRTDPGSLHCAAASAAAAAAAAAVELALGQRPVGRRHRCALQAVRRQRQYKPPAKGRRSDVPNNGNNGDNGDGDGDNGDVVDWTGVLYGDAADPQCPWRGARPQTLRRGSNAPLV